MPEHGVAAASFLFFFPSARRQRVYTSTVFSVDCCSPLARVRGNTFFHVEQRTSEASSFLISLYSSFLFGDCCFGRSIFN